MHHLGGGFRPCDQIAEAGLQTAVEDRGIPKEIPAALLDQYWLCDGLDRSKGLREGGPVDRGLAGNAGHVGLSGRGHRKSLRPGSPWFTQAKRGCDPKGFDVILEWLVSDRSGRCPKGKVGFGPVPSEIRQAEVVVPNHTNG